MSIQIHLVYKGLVYKGINDTTCTKSLNLSIFSPSSILIQSAGAKKQREIVIVPVGLFFFTSVSGSPPRTNTLNLLGGPLK